MKYFKELNQSFFLRCRSTASTCFLYKYLIEVGSLFRGIVTAISNSNDFLIFGPEFTDNI